MAHLLHMRAAAGVNPQRYLDGFTWDEFKWRRGELQAQFQGMTVLAGVDDMDSFKGIDLKLQVGVGARACCAEGGACAYCLARGGLCLLPC